MTPFGVITFEKASNNKTGHQVLFAVEVTAIDGIPDPRGQIKALVAGIERELNGVKRFPPVVTLSVEFYEYSSLREQTFITQEAIDRLKAAGIETELKPTPFLEREAAKLGRPEELRKAALVFKAYNLIYNQATRDLGLRLNYRILLDKVRNALVKSTTSFYYEDLATANLVCEEPFSTTIARVKKPRGPIHGLNFDLDPK